MFIDLTQSHSYSTSLNVSLPAAVVPGSEIVELTALGQFCLHDDDDDDDGNDDLFTCPSYSFVILFSGCSAKEVMA